ncbi:hypothetical protein T4D_15937 [Trichinella pseudospiralis]|uniref:Uncharacterized protein n=1 Tax=Trichinella pseudospiralis TaxID=6337 RepID=A0A0V1F9W5_TRIPS|nr:hypothetical protein T4D_15937 [Trichinella pseudospiralis]
MSFVNAWPGEVNNEQTAIARCSRRGRGRFDYHYLSLLTASIRSSANNLLFVFSLFPTNDRPTLIQAFCCQLNTGEEKKKDEEQLTFGSLDFDETNQTRCLLFNDAVVHNARRPSSASVLFTFTNSIDHDDRSCCKLISHSNTALTRPLGSAS